MEVTREHEKFQIIDEGLDGYIIEYENVDYYCDLCYPYVRFRCFDDYSKFFDIDCWLHFLYSEKCASRSSLIRDDERLFYNNLTEVEKLVDYCKKIERNFQGKIAFYRFFEQIGNFIREYKHGFKHNNKKIEKKFNKVAKELEKICNK